MRYITNADGYLQMVSFGADIACNGQSCTEYTGAVPEGYDSLADWYGQESEKLYRWKIVEGELSLDTDAEAPVESDPDAELAEKLKSYLPLAGGTMTGDLRTTARHYLDTALAESFGAGLGNIIQAISTDGTVTPVLSGVYDGNRVYGVEFRNDVNTPAMRIYAGENYIELGAWGFKFNDKRQGQTLLWSGELSTGSATFDAYGYEYNRYLVVGRMASGYPLVSVQCPAELMSDSQKWGLSDEGYYINFILTTGSVQIATNSSGTGAIVAVYGIN